MNLFDPIWKSTRLIARRPHLIILGLLMIILSAGGRSYNLITRFVNERLFLAPQVGQGLIGLIPRVRFDALRQLLASAINMGLPGVLLILVGSILLAIVLGMLYLIVRGGVIASAGAAYHDQPSDLGMALAAGWRKTWQLLIIVSIPPIPITLAAILLVLIAVPILQGASGAEVLLNAGVERRSMVLTLAGIGALLFLPTGLISFGLGLLAHPAQRACLLEDLRPVAAFRRAWTVIRANFFPAVLLAVLTVAFNIVTGIALSLLLALLAWILIPVVLYIWLLEGVIDTWLACVWTLVWQAWSEKTPRL
jgi:hypothetical protein